MNLHSNFYKKILFKKSRTMPKHKQEKIQVFNNKKTSKRKDTWKLLDFLGRLLLLLGTKIKVLLPVPIWPKIISSIFDPLGSCEKFERAFHAPIQQVLNEIRIKKTQRDDSGASKTEKRFLK
jgi:hypothetical protein